MNSQRINKDSIPDYAPCSIELPNGWRAAIDTPRDYDMGPPWKEHDGHGPVSERTTRDKRPGERVLHVDYPHRRYYDFAEAVRIARKDGWGCQHPEHVTRGQKAACAAEQDFQRMRDWCMDYWEWIGVTITITDAEGNHVADAAVWGIESDSDYWREVAADLVNELAGGLVLPVVG